MNSLKRILPAFAAGNTEFFWLYSMILTLTFFINNRGFPLLTSYAVFWLVVVVTKLLRSRRMYTLSRLLIYIPIYLVTAVLVMSAFYDTSETLFDFGWITLMWSNLSGVKNIFFLLLIIFGLTMLWVFGVTFGVSSNSYKDTIKRLEKSIITVFFIAFLAGIIKLTIPHMSSVVLGMFLWGILSVALSKNSLWGVSSRYAHSSLRLIGFFMAALFVSILAIISLGMDYLAWTAQRSLETIRIVFDPVISFLFGVLKSVFEWMGYNVINDPSAPNTPLTPSGPEKIGVGADGYTQLILYLMLGVLILLAVCIIFLLLVILFKALLTKRGMNQPNLSLAESLQEVWEELQAVFRSIKKHIMDLVLRRNVRTVEKIYLKLISWGTLRGIIHFSSETPLEYSVKLAEKYCHRTDDFQLIAEYFCLEVYGGRTLDPSQELSLKKAWQSIRKTV